MFHVYGKVGQDAPTPPPTHTPTPHTPTPIPHPTPLYPLKDFASYLRNQCHNKLTRMYSEHNQWSSY